MPQNLNAPKSFLDMFLVSNQHFHAILHGRLSLALKVPLDLPYGKSTWRSTSSKQFSSSPTTNPKDGLVSYPGISIATAASTGSGAVTTVTGDGEDSCPAGLESFVR